jgi:hypothetical protein
MADDERVKKVFGDALEVDRAERETFLRTACGADLELRNEVALLLKSHDRGEAFLEVPMLDIGADEIAEQILGLGQAVALPPEREVVGG